MRDVLERVDKENGLPTDGSKEPNVKTEKLLECLALDPHLMRLGVGIERDAPNTVALCVGGDVRGVWVADILGFDWLPAIDGQTLYRATDPQSASNVTTLILDAHDAL